MRHQAEQVNEQFQGFIGDERVGGGKELLIWAINSCGQEGTIPQAPVSEDSTTGHKLGHPNAELLLTLSSYASIHCLFEHTFHHSSTILEGTKKHIVILS